MSSTVQKATMLAKAKEPDQQLPCHKYQHARIRDSMRVQRCDFMLTTLKGQACKLGHDGLSP